METIRDIDVLIIGGGAAGCRAALEARDCGARTAIAVKGGFGRVPGLRGTGASGRAGSPLGFSDIPHVVGGGRISVKPEEEQQALFDLMLQAGLGMADPKLVKILMEEAPAAKQSLKRWGLVSDEYEPFIHCFITPIPGLSYVVRAAADITILENMMAVKLLIHDGACVGILALDENSGETVRIYCKSVILATGGAGGLYMHHFQPSCITGDGYAMAFEAGAELLNMEFQQMIWATIYPTTNILPGIWGANPSLRNQRGEPFLEKYIPEGIRYADVLKSKLQHWPFSSRDISKYLDIAAVKETRAGGAVQHGGFQLETANIDTDCWELLMVPHCKEYLKFRGVDWDRSTVEVNVAYHCHNGGILVDENGQSSIEGLYAVGETAAGPYGADRIAGSMMASGQVFGIRAGRHAAKKARGKAMWEGSSCEKDEIAELRRMIQLDAGQARRMINHLQRSAWENLLVVKDEMSLNCVEHDIQQIWSEVRSKERSGHGTDPIRAAELNSLLRIGEMITCAARTRKESRGNHYREDFPKQDNTRQAAAVLVKKVGEQVETEFVVRDPQWKNKEEDMNGLSWG